MRLKYVIIDNCFPVLFGEYFEHKAFRKNGEITSAGFVKINQIEENGKIQFKANCFGESVGLGLKPMSDDYVLIEQVLNK